MAHPLWFESRTEEKAYDNIGNKFHTYQLQICTCKGRLQLPRHALHQILPLSYKDHNNKKSL